MALPQFSSSVTALSWVGLCNQSVNGLIAIGMESGIIELWSISIGRTDNGSSNKARGMASILVRLDPFMCHVSPVQHLAWRESEQTGDCEHMQLASCGADHCVRVFEVMVD